MRCILILLAVLLLPAQTINAQTQAVGPFELPWWLSDDVRELVDEQDMLVQRLESLLVNSSQADLRAGFHAQIRPRPDNIEWVQVDLGREYAISTIALVPARVQVGNASVDGYGFPTRFRVQVSNDPDFRTATLAADYTGSDCPNPGRFPLQITGLEQRGRYVRITITRQTFTSGRWFSSLGELIVMSGNRNVAALRPVTASGSVETPDRWSRQYLVDTISMLPLPMVIFSSRSDGYLSAEVPAEVVRQGRKVEKWIQLDLGDQYPIDEIRLTPARPPGETDVPGWGFPKGFRIELATSPDFADAVTYCDFSTHPLQHWTDRPLILPAENRNQLRRGILQPDDAVEDFPAEVVSAQYVRLVATELDDRLKSLVLALSEFQVYSGNLNAAVDAVVTVSDVTKSKEHERWAPQFLVDDFTSRARLLEFPVWLSQLEDRREKQRRLAVVTRQLEVLEAEIWTRVSVGSGSFAVLLIGALTWFNRRQSIRLRRQTEELRTQIASDLHDDIGSNLGTIALMVQSIRHEENLPGSIQPDLDEIRQVALETSDAMRDILWLIRTPNSRMDDFIGRLRGTLSRLLPPGCESSFRCPEELFERTIPLSWRRNVFLSYKETLHNAARHSQAKQISVNVVAVGVGIQLTVADDGVGFDFETRREGLGIGSIRRRISELGGTAEFVTAPGKGTAVTMTVPFAITPYRRLGLSRYLRRTPS